MNLNTSNPFTNKSVSKAYKDTDPAYAQSVAYAVKILQPQVGLSYADIGGGTGISSEAIIAAGAEKLVVIEPSPAMAAEAQVRLDLLEHNSEVEFIETDVENSPEKCGKACVDAAFALNCFHLFPDHQKALIAVSMLIKSGGKFLFNLSMPSLAFEEMSERAKLTTQANLDFYVLLLGYVQAYNQAVVPILQNTVAMMNALITGESEHSYTPDRMRVLVEKCGMKQLSYTENSVVVEAQYQQHIWAMVAKGFVQDEQQIKALIDQVKLPEKIEIQQGFFLLEV